MKKLLVFLLLIAMLGMVACGKDSTDKKDETPVGGITEPTTVPTEDPHAGWTNVFGQIYIPNMPFEDWGGTNQDNISCYTIHINSRNSAAFHEYVASLADFGYTIEQTESYSYKGTDPEGRSIHLTDFENGQMQINIYY